jgi:hypothetical protein
MDLSTTGDVSLVPQIVEQRQAFYAEFGSAVQSRFQVAGPSDMCRSTPKRRVMDPKHNKPNLFHVIQLKTHLLSNDLVEHAGNEWGLSGVRKSLMVALF